MTRKKIRVYSTIDERWKRTLKGSYFVFEGIFAPASQLDGNDTSDPLFMMKKYYGLTKQLSRVDIVNAYASELYVSSTPTGAHGRFHDPTASMKNEDFHPPVSGTPINFWEDGTGNLWIRWIGPAEDGLRWARREATHLSLADFCEYYREKNSLKEKRTLAHVAFLPSDVPPEWSECVVTNAYPLTPQQCCRKIMAEFSSAKLLMPKAKRPPPTQFSTLPLRKEGTLKGTSKGRKGGADISRTVRSHERSENPALTRATMTDTTQGSPVSTSDSTATQSSDPISTPTEVLTQSNTSTEVTTDATPGVDNSGGTEPSGTPTDTAASSGGASGDVSESKEAINEKVLDAQTFDKNLAEATSVLENPISDDASSADLEASLGILTKTREALDLEAVPKGEPGHEKVAEAIEALEKKISDYRTAIDTVQTAEKKAAEEAKVKADTEAKAAADSKSHETPTKTQVDTSTEETPTIEVNQELLANLLEAVSAADGANDTFDTNGITPLDRPGGTTNAILEVAARSSYRAGANAKLTASMRYVTETIKRSRKIAQERYRQVHDLEEKQRQESLAEAQRKARIVSTANGLLSGNKRTASERMDATETPREELERFKRRRLEELKARMRDGQ